MLRSFSASVLSLEIWQISQPLWFSWGRPCKFGLDTSIWEKKNTLVCSVRELFCCILTSLNFENYIQSENVPDQEDKGQLRHFLQFEHCQRARTGFQTSKVKDCLSRASTTTSWHSVVGRNGSHTTADSLQTRALWHRFCVQHLYTLYMHIYTFIYSIYSKKCIASVLQGSTVSLANLNWNLLARIFWRADVTLALSLMSPKCWIKKLT